MDAIRKLKAAVVEEVHKECDPEVGDRLKNMRKGLAFFAACMTYNALRLLLAIPASPPYIVQDLKVKLLAVTAMVSLLAWFGSMILILSEQPMKKRVWTRMFHWMVYIAMISFMVTLTTLIGIRLGWWNH